MNLRRIRAALGLNLWTWFPTSPKHHLRELNNTLRAFKNAEYKGSLYSIVFSKQRNRNERLEHVLERVANGDDIIRTAPSGQYEVKNNHLK